MSGACASSGRSFVRKIHLSRTIAHRPSVMPLAGARVPAPAATRPNRGEAAANAATPLGEDLLGGGRGYSDPPGPGPGRGRPSIGLPTAITRGNRRVLLTAGYLWTAARA